LQKQLFPLERINLLIVDHESTDDTFQKLSKFRDLLAGKFRSFQIHSRPNFGFGAGHDFAIRQLQDEFVLVSNVDIEFHADTLTKLWNCANIDEGDIASWEVRQCPYEHPKYYDPVTLETSWSSHACVLLRRRAYEECGGYDLKIFMYGEDVELSYRFRGRGWRLRYLPQISVTHFVDFEDTSLRPHQLSGSIAASVLLKHRYSSVACALDGERIVNDLLQLETDAARRDAILSAVKKIALDKEHFKLNLRPVVQCPFPFNGFDFEMIRDGHDVEINSQESMGGAPLVSIITRTHGNKLQLLRESISSVLNQTYSNIEHIIVEDRTDFAAALVEEARSVYGCNIKYLKSDGVGRSRAGNFGLENACGDYLMFLDNDDLLFPDHVEILARSLNESVDSVAAYSLAWDVSTTFDVSGNYTEVLHTVPFGHRLGYDVERLRQMNFIPIQSILFRCSLFETEGGFDEDLEFLEDWNLWVRYSQHGHFKFIPKLTSKYKTPADQDSRQFRQSQLDGAYAMVKNRNDTLVKASVRQRKS
jgi:GT2 family glycosyltransferase